jgi:inhibitor of KinA sporulation pathway (predicted exonuclease)
MRLDKMLVVDVEQTCWDGEPPEGQSPEIIEIGVAEIVLDGARAAVGRRASHLVRPVRSTVSEFCTALTGIDAKMLKSRGRPLREVCNSIRKEFGGANKTWMAWGRDDEDILRACAEAGAEPPFSGCFVDLGQMWASLTGAGKSVGLQDALRGLGLEFDGTPHRADDDAYNTARVMAEMSTILRARLALDAAPRGPAP